MKTILFCGGGSAGHVVPNIALIEEFKDSYNCVYMGTDGIEKSICGQNGVDFYEVNTPKLVRGKIFCNLSIPFKLLKSVKNAGKILDEVKPALIFSKGGFACLPAVFAAKKRKIAVITHESDIDPGLATKIIAKRCKKVLTSFPSAASAFPNGICCGSPMRKGLFGVSRADAEEKFGLDHRPTILVLGGGSGSLTINGYIRDIAQKICKDYNILHICGKGNQVKSNIYGYRQVEFCKDMGYAYACADMAVSRCGSNTAFELTALKIPTLYIPLDNSATRGDQIKNAEYFKNLGLCEILPEKELTDERLYGGIISVMKNGKIKAGLLNCNIKPGNEKIKKEAYNTILQRS